jgi:hypothetical protein
MTCKSPQILIRYASDRTSQACIRFVVILGGDDAGKMAAEAMFYSENNPVVGRIANPPLHFRH